MTKPKFNVSPGCMFGIVILITFVAWGSAMFVGAYREYKAAIYAEPATKATRQFLMFVGSGNLTSAKAMSSDAITLEALTAANEQIEAWGGLSGDLSQAMGWKVQDMDAIEIDLPVEFVKTKKTLSTQWKMDGAAPRLQTFEFKEPPSELSSPTTKP